MSSPIRCKRCNSTLAPGLVEGADGLRIGLVAGLSCLACGWEIALADVGKTLPMRLAVRVTEGVNYVKAR